MTKCPYCNQPIPETATVCPHCQADLTQPALEEQDTLFTEQPTTEEVTSVEAIDTAEETIPQEEVDELIELFEQGESISRPTENERIEPPHYQDNQPKRFIKESRHYQSNHGLQATWSKFSDYFVYLKNYLLEPSFKRRTRRTENTYHGYITLVLTVLFSASAFTRLVTGFISQYNFFANISILPAFDANPDPIWLWVKSIVFFTLFYFGLIVLSYFLKRIFLKRKHAFHYWVTQFEGTNTIALLISLTAFVLALIAPVFLSSLIIFLLLMTLATYFTTFTGAIYKTMNDSAIDHLYVILIGWFIHLFVTMASFYILYL
ncbi:zinc ribbon domain-containing protein [Atopobacter phocae]|uniref:zinc ribbon domain-containing protein n=1 Tax=Atopobacter phocae TaxID=136492 RepID=UPI0004700228|nr:zinc ribbon domain-containing protein [Atopobacter phocae]